VTPKEPAEDYLSAAAVARILGVSRQRVSTMVREGDLPAVYPWPRAVRIPRSAVDAWVKGERRVPITRTAARQFVVETAGVATIEQLLLPASRKLCRQFINERRPEWSVSERREWVDDMADYLASRR
jgi:excisionase family DNA binding protein